MDLRQSPEYAHYLELLGWQVEKINNCQIFIRQFPLIGSIVKIQRPENLSSIGELFAVIKRYRAFQITIEPLQRVSKYGFKKSKSPYLPTKTIQIDLTQSEEKIFANFSSAKRRAIRKAIKNKVTIKQGKEIEGLIALKNTQNGFLGRFLRIDKQFKALWQAFWPKKAILLLAYSTFSACVPSAGLLLLFHDKIAYYYQAASTNQGNQLAAPSLLVWEALKIAKKKRCKIFDFEGIYDSRFPQKDWHGFTKFKMGFGGEEIAYPPPLVKTSFLLPGFTNHFVFTKLT